MIIVLWVENDLLNHSGCRHKQSVHCLSKESCLPGFNIAHIMCGKNNGDIFFPVNGFNKLPDRNLGLGIKANGRFV